MKKQWWLAGGAGAGAVLMYLFDPDRGTRRRAGLRDKMRHAVRSSGNALKVSSRHLGQRLLGLAARSMPKPVSEMVSDDVLAERVRSQIGHVSGHTHPVCVAVRNGRVTLSGPLAGEEVRRVLQRASRVPGVKSVINEFEVYEHRQTGS